jgi:Cd2+/Zn2+-exporting ATPase
VPVIIGFIGVIPFHIPLIASIIGYILFGFEVYGGMISGFKRKKIFTEFTLMCVATIGAFAIGEFADAAAVMYLYSLGETISSGAYARSKASISQLIEITPDRANLVNGVQTDSVDPDEVRAGDIILVRAGERIPLDGVVVSGGGSADTSSVTGESKPLELYDGVACPSGALLNDGSVHIRVTSEYHNSVAFRLKQAVAQASKKKSVAEKKITRFAAVFTPMAFCVAICVFTVGAIVTHNVNDWLRAAIMVLVVSCPCSLVLSVPLTYFAGIGNAAKRGIVFRGGEVMDRVAALNCIALDKTGTITEAGLSFDRAVILSDVSNEEFLKLSASVLVHSPHAAAISFCQHHGAREDVCVENVQIISGRGVVCTVDGKTVFYGNARLMRENGIDAPDSAVTAIYGARDGALLGRLEFSSHLKSGMKDTVKQMRDNGVDRITVISGDAELSVKQACDEAGIEEYFSGLAPDEKLSTLENIVNEQKEKSGYVAYCGDGLNDSAVIAAADVGIAMGGCGSALTVESADVVLMDDKPEKINTAIRIARRTSKVANSNIALSLGIKVGVLIAGVVLAYLKVEVPIELAIVADVGAAVIAVLNSLRASRGDA